MHTKIFPLVTAAALFVSCSLSAEALSEPLPGSATGKGVIERFIPGGDSDAEPVSEQVVFSPKYSMAYTDSAKNTWLVLTEAKPPVQKWLTAKDPSEARRLWCEKEKASFVAVKLDPTWAVDLYFLCPGNGNVNTEMVSTINGLNSIVVNFETRSSGQLKGTISGGEGNCPSADGKDTYCTPQEEFTFDAPLLRLQP